MTYAQQFILRRGHPRQIILHLVGVIWGLYFLYQHNWIFALGAFALSELCAESLTSFTDVNGLAGTTLGKIMLLHAHPLNLMLQLAGGVLLLYGVWMHSLPCVMAAISLVLVGHFWGWNKVSAFF